MDGLGGRHVGKEVATCHPKQVTPVQMVSGVEGVV